MKDHDLTDSFEPEGILYEERPVLDRSGEPVPGLHNIWITLDNPEELNSYTTETIKEVILAFRRASNDRAAVAVVFTGSGDRAFCTGGNTREYAEVYAGAPGEYRQYMRLFNDMVTAILHCDKPVICRVNGMRVGGAKRSAWPATSRSLRIWRSSRRLDPSMARHPTAAPPISCRSSSAWSTP